MKTKMKLEHDNETLTIRVEESALGGLAIHQGYDLIYIDEDRIRKFVAAVRAVASDILGEEV